MNRDGLSQIARSMILDVTRCVIFLDFLRHGAFSYCYFALLRPAQSLFYNEHGKELSSTTSEKTLNLTTDEFSHGVVRGGGGRPVRPGASRPEAVRPVGVDMPK